MADITKSFLTHEGLQEYDTKIKEFIAGSTSGGEVYVTETAGGSSDPFGKRYGLYQGGGSAQAPVPAEKIADIDIPKDMVVESGSVVDITYSNGKLYDNGTDVTALIKGTGGTATAADAGKYLKLIIANATSDVVYISVKDLGQIYTVQPNASEVQLAIDANNVISATIVTIDGSKITYSVSETVKQALTRLDGSDSTTGSVSKKIKDAISALDTSANVPIATYYAATGSTGDKIELTSAIAESDGIVEGVSGNKIILTAITNAQIDALFS